LNKKNKQNIQLCNETQLLLLTLFKNSANYSFKHNMYSKITPQTSVNLVLI